LIEVPKNGGGEMGSGSSKERQGPIKRVLAIVPAHNEEKNLPIVIRGLKAQTYPTTVCIVSDNSTDNTAALARELGADIVTETVGNTGMRAGAINWGLKHFSGDYDYVLAMDADSTCAPSMIAEGKKMLEDDLRLGAVCSRAGVLPQSELKSIEQKILWHLQHLEYGTYDSSRVETTGMIKVAHGLATLFRREALDGQLRTHGYVYNIKALTEDYTLTLDLKEQGWRITSCQQMLAWTIVPTRVRWWWKQRSRWNLGGLDTLVSHGLSKYTFWDWFAHAMSVFLFLVEVMVCSLIVYLAYHGEPVYVSGLFWIVAGTMWFGSLYRLRYVQSLDKWDILMCVSFLPAVLYYYLQLAVLLNSYKQYLAGEKRSY